MTTSVPSPVATSVDALARQQARVDLLLARAVTGEGWRARLAAGDRERPLLADFVPDDPERVAGYRAVHPVELVEQLRTGQAALFDSVAALTPAELDRAGVHEVDGPVSLADLVAFLPGHQRDHADQLAALLGRG